MSEDSTPEPSSSETSARPLTFETTPEDRTMAMLAHIGSLAGFIIPFGNIAAPLVIWLIKKDQSKFVDDQGKESLNFQINITVQAVILTIVGIVTCGFGFFLMIPWGIYILIMPIIGGVKANSGEAYRYPATIRVL